MRNYLNFFLFALLFVFISNKKASSSSFKNRLEKSFLKTKTTGWSRDYFKGFWVGEGYSCNDRKDIPEDINVHYDDENMIAVKVRGSDCVHANQKTFSAKLVDVWKNDIPCNLILGSPTKPQSADTDDCKIEIKDINNFEVKDYGIKFRRGRLPQKEYAHDFFIGTWIGEGYKCGDKKDLEEEIEVNYEKGVAIATKISGDSCVRTGKVTFKTVLQDSYVKCGENWIIPCALQIGTVEEPENAWDHKCNINIVDYDHFEIPEWGLKYKRKSCDLKDVHEVEEKVGGF